MAAPSLGGATLLQPTASASSISVTKPTGLADGDWWIAAISKDDDPDIAAPPEGWITMIQTSTTGGRDRSILVACRYVADASAEPSSYSFTFADTEEACGVSFYARDCDPYMPFDSVADYIAIDPGTSINLQVTTLKDDARLIGILFGVGTGFYNSTITWPTGWESTFADAKYGTSAGAGTPRVVVGTDTQATAGSTGSLSFQTSGSSDFYGILFALREDQSSTPSALDTVIANLSPEDFFKLNETTGTTATNDGTGADGVYQGTPTLGQDTDYPVAGKYMTLDASADYVRVPSPNETGDFTFCVLGRLENDPASQVSFLVSNHANEFNSGGWTWGRDSSDRWYPGMSGTEYTNRVGGRVELDVWYFCVVRRDGTNSKLDVWVNRVPGPINNPTAPNGTWPTYARLGSQVKSQSITVRYWRGSIGLYAYWPSALTDANVASLIEAYEAEAQDTGGTQELEGDGANSSAGDGDMENTISIGGEGAAANAGEGELLGDVPLDGTGSASAAGEGDITGTRNLSGEGANASDGSGSVSVTVQIDGEGANAADGEGELTVQGAATAYAGWGIPIG